MKRSDVLNIANNLISGDRARDYGDAKENFQRIARLWSVYAGREFTEVDVGVMMMLLKIARLSHTNTHEDSYFDIAGYAALTVEMFDEADD